MAKVHVDDYRRAENCRVKAERASGDRKAKWIDLAERWDEAADRVGVSAAAVDAKRDKNLFALEVDRRQEPPMQDITHPNLDASSWSLAIIIARDFHHRRSRLRFDPDVRRPPL